MKQAPTTQRGHTLVGLLAGVSLLATLLVGAFMLDGSRKRRATEAAALELAGLMRSTGLEAVTSGSSHAIVFSGNAGGEPFRIVRDGNGDGVSRADIVSGTDPPGPPRTVSQNQPGVMLGRPASRVLPALPPSRGTMSPGDPALRFGAARMVVFTPEGHATPGSLFLTDGNRETCAVVVAGPTARIRTFCFDGGQRTWRLR